MNRLVLVSDPTKEFPNNTTSSFKVRLPVPLEMKGEGWKVGLAAISTPDAALDLTRLSDALKNYVYDLYEHSHHPVGPQFVEETPGNGDRGRYHW